MSGSTRFLVRAAAVPAGVQALFLVLRLTGAVRWSWWAVLSPAWGSAAFILAGGGIVFAALGRWSR